MHETFMALALELALKGRGGVHPNPLVGALLVVDEKVIGSGFHASRGKAHAEVSAIKNARTNGFTDLSGSTLYVTLEPCSHFGKTPPCTDLIISCGIKTVVIGMIDPNPLVSGQGIIQLRKAGVTVLSGILENQCKIQNKIFCKYITTGLPYVLLKTAQSLDGKTATYTGDSQWISGEESRQDVQRLRSEYTAIMCGINTVITDNPLLTARNNDDRCIQKINPVRIIVDSHLRIPLDSRIVKTAYEIPTIIATTENTHSSKIKILEEAGITILYVPEKNNRVDLVSLMKILGSLEIDSILLEGGSTLAFAAIQEKLVDRIRFYIAPLLIGGDTAKGSLGGIGFPTLKTACIIQNLQSSFLGTDIIVEGDLCSPA